MFNSFLLLIIACFVFLLVVILFNFIESIINYKRFKVLRRLRKLEISSMVQPDDDILSRPFRERTLGYLSKWIVDKIRQITPLRMQEKVDQRLKKAGYPQGIKAGDLLAAQGILGTTILLGSLFLLLRAGNGVFNTLLLSLCLTMLVVYLPWFILGLIAVKRQQEIRRRLPEMMDLLVVSVEAGLGFDLALAKVSKRYRGAVAEEFQQALWEMQLGKARKDALRGISERVDLEELSSLVNAVVQSDQLGVGLGRVLRVQSDLIRQKQQQWVEEQAMKAPIKMLFPLIFLIFPCMFIVILGPAIINIMRTLGN